MVSLHARHCPHCGASVLARAQSEGSKLKCPACEAQLVVTDLGDLKLHQCHVCGGLWLFKEVFDQVAASHENRGQILGVLPGESPKVQQAGPFETVRYRPCPHCGKFMNRVNYARISKVIVDVCKDHGLWFDKDELRQVIEFIDSGGLVKAQERERTLLEEERERMAMQQAGGGMPAMEIGERPAHTPLNIADVVETGSLLGKILVGTFETLLGQFKH